ncbi:MAG: CBS domain-containing protein [Stellaceae bacterium]
MNAADVMSNDMFVVNTDMTVLDAARAMLQHRISGVPVRDWQGKVVGMLTEGDLLRRAETGTERHRARWLELLFGPGRAAQDYTMAHARKVGDVMTDRVVAAAPETPLSEVVALMEQNHIKRVPVLSGERLLGIVSRADLLRALVMQSEKAVTAEPGNDAEIKARILAELDRQSWTPRAIVIEVKHGAVELKGTITDERERAALKIVCENTAGVKEVVDHLIWVEPLSGMVIEPPEETAKRS